jgi:hypothetical protein
MNTESFRALRRANPRTRPDFAQSVDAAAATVHARIAQESLAPETRSRPRPRRAYVSVAVGSVAAAATAAAFLAVTLPGGGPGVESAQAAVDRAVNATAASAEDSGTAAVRMTYRGDLWAAKVIRWNGTDVAISREGVTDARKPGSDTLVVDGVLYGIDPELGWVRFGSPSSIDPGSGATPAEHLAAVRQDVGGATLRRVTEGMTDLATRTLADGSTVYSGTVGAGLVARETGVKDGETLRVLPFGYVANGAATDPEHPLGVSLTVGADGVIREIAVTWESWTYTATYTALGTTAAPAAPQDAKPIRKLRATG